MIRLNFLEMNMNLPKLLFFLLLILGYIKAFEFQDSSESFLPKGFYHESYGEPEFDSLLAEFDYDETAKKGTTEFQQQCLLMNWQYYKIPFNAPDNVCVRQALCTLRKAIHEGQPFHCVNMSATFMQCALSLGWTVRIINLPSHTTTEIWSNQYKKWVYMEVTWNVHVEDKNGIPLSLAEARAEYARNNAEDIVYVFGVGDNENRFTYKDMPYDRPQDKNSVYDSSRKIYRDYLMFLCRPFYVGRNNFLTTTNHFGTGYSIVDDISQHMTDWINIWLQRGNNKKFNEENLHQLYHDVNRTDVAIKKLTEDNVIISLDAFGYNNYTPNFKEFQIRKNGGPWTKIEKEFNYQLNNDIDSLEFRSRNKWDVSGPVTSIAVGKFDNKAPSIENVTTHMLNDSSISVRWQTDEYAECKISYGKSVTDKEISVKPAGRLHEVKLLDLDPNSTYQYKISAIDLFGNTITTNVRTYSTVKISNKKMDFEGELPSGWDPAKKQLSSKVHEKGQYSFQVPANSNLEWKISEENTYGRVTFYVYDSGVDTSDAENKDQPTLGPHWGVMNKDGSWICIGINRHSKNKWNSNYGLTESDDLKWTYPLFHRKPGWNKWFFDISREGTLNITMNDTTKSVIYNFRWPWDKVTTGFNRIFFKGESTGGPETLYIDDISVTVLDYSSSVGVKEPLLKTEKKSFVEMLKMEASNRKSISLSVKLNKQSRVRIEFFSLNGKRIGKPIDRNLNSGENRILLSKGNYQGISSGRFYIIRITTDSNINTWKMFSL